MKLLFDENIPEDLLQIFENCGHEVFHINRTAWKGLQNGELMKVLKENPQFEVFILADQNLPYQQNLSELPQAFVILCAKRRGILIEIAEIAAKNLSLVVKGEARIVGEAKKTCRSDFAFSFQVKNNL